MNISKIISIVLHPIFMPIIGFYLSLQLIPNIGFAITNYLGFIYPILIFTTIIFPVISLFFLIKGNVISSFEITNYRERPLPLFITAISIGVGYYMLKHILVFSQILQAELLGAIIIIISASVISIYWKISLHMLGLGGLVGVFFSLNTLFGGLSHIIIISVLFGGVLGVSRLNEKAHNTPQIYTGFLVGFLIESATILLF
tara:strand:+ start:1029 stop:1631 length:603 start_codon:yes stop_codon:yes gene_type:complete